LSYFLYLFYFSRILLFPIILSVSVTCLAREEPLILFIRSPSSNSIRMFVLQVMLLLILYVGGLVAFKVTVCDCSEPLQTGILQFSDEDCVPGQKKSDLQPVRYSVYTEIRAETKIPGLLCGRWKQQKHITTIFFFQKVIVLDKVAFIIRRWSAGPCIKVAAMSSQWKSPKTNLCSIKNQLKMVGG
jgi:hypothetical protein